MAQLACGVVGAVAGAYFGPVGAQVGFALGSAIGGLLFAPDQPAQEGPRLADLSVTSSTYGLPIPFVRGVVRLPGNLIWSSGLKETRSKSKAGGKGGLGGGSKVVSYTYSASFAVAFCEGPCDKLLRLWFDNALAYDATAAAGDTTAIEGLVVRFHRGDEAQLPDPAMAAALPEGECPAHRGLCYAVVEDLDLGRFGNRIPTVSAEVAHAAEPVLAAAAGEVLDPAASPLSPFASVAYENLFAADWTRNLGYRGIRGFLKGSGEQSSGLAVVDLATLRELRHVAVRFSPDPRLAVDQGGDVYWTAGRALFRLDGDTLAVKDAWGAGPLPYGHGGFSGINPAGPRGAIASLAVMSATDPATGLPAVFVAGVTITGNPFVLDVPVMAPLWGATEEEDGTPFPAGAYPDPVGAGAVAVPGEVQQVRLVFWLCDAAGGLSNDGVHLHKLRVQYAGSSVPDTVDDVEFTRDAGRIAPADVAAGLSRLSPGAVDYDAPSDALVFRTADRAWKWSAARGVWWARAPKPGHAFGRGVSGASRLAGQFLGLGADEALMLDLADGSTAFEGTFPLRQPLAPAELWDGLGWRLFAAPAGPPAPVLRYDYNRAAGRPCGLDTLVEDLCAAAGLPPSRVDATGLAGELVDGAVFGQQPAREAIQRLQPAFLFDAAESAGRLVFRKRGRPPVAAIPYGGLLRTEGGGAAGPSAAFREQRIQELEIPRAVSVRYRDRDRDQLQGTQRWARPRAPTATAGSVGEANLDLPLVMGADRAKAIARTAVAAAWAERTVVEGIALPLANLALEPGDVVELGTRDGAALRVRLDKLDIGADYTLRASGVTEQPAAYSSLAAPADPGAFPRPAVAAAANAALFWADLPLLLDAHEAGGAGLRTYAGALPLTGPWTGGGLHLSSDAGSSWSRVGDLPPAGLAWGHAVAPLPAPRSPWTWDDANALRLAPAHGGDRFEPATDAEVLDGANACAVLLPDGRAEIVQFARCVHEPDGSVTLSRLLRGRRGTEDACGLATAGARVVLLEADALDAPLLPHEARGAPRLARLQPRNRAFDGLPRLPRVFTGRAERPYAPVHLRGGRDAGTGDLLLSWIRRTRVGGGLMPGTGAVPLGETAEAYEVDVLADDRSSVLRTIAAAAPAAAYTAAMQLQDTGGAGLRGAVPVRVYQISGRVGRGIPAEATL